MTDIFAREKVVVVSCDSLLVDERTKSGSYGFEDHCALRKLIGPNLSIACKAFGGIGTMPVGHVETKMLQLDTSIKFGPTGLNKEVMFVEVHIQRVAIAYDYKIAEGVLSHQNKATCY